MLFVGLSEVVGPIHQCTNTVYRLLTSSCCSFSSRARRSVLCLLLGSYQLSYARYTINSHKFIVAMPVRSRWWKGLN